MSYLFLKILESTIKWHNITPSKLTNPCSKINEFLIHHLKLVWGKHSRWKNSKHFVQINLTSPSVPRKKAAQLIQHVRLEQTFGKIDITNNIRNFLEHFLTIENLLKINGLNVLLRKRLEFLARWIELKFYHLKVVINLHKSALKVTIALP